MTLRSDILARFTGEGGAAPLFLPDLTLWHTWHRERGTLPSAWRDFTLPQAARHLNAPIWAVVRPWQTSYTRDHHHERGECRGAGHPP